MAAKTIRWGILATGGIAKSFSLDLTVDPTTRGEKTLKHEIVAAASSSSESRAKDFLKDVGAPAHAKAYGSYKEFVQDPNVDVVYVATPHSHHYQNTMLCLEAGKNVLCEKSFTVNAAQAKALVAKAKEKNLFLMEAVWTRYFPLSIYVRNLITSGELGVVTRVQADLSIREDLDKLADNHRLRDEKLAGGALLDLGIYALTWNFQTLYHTQPVATRKPPTVKAMVRRFEKTGVDAITTMILTFPRSVEQGGDAHAIATTSVMAGNNPDQKGSAGPCVRIQGTLGEVVVFPPTFRPERTRLVKYDGTVEDREFAMPGPGKGSGFYNGFGGTVHPEGQGHGMFYEADEAGHALLEGRKEGRFLGWDESILIMETMDEVRRQGGIKYPANIESTDYPLDL